MTVRSVFASNTERSIDRSKLQINRQDGMWGLAQKYGADCAMWPREKVIDVDQRTADTRPRNGAQDVDRKRHLVLERGRQERPHPDRPTCRSHRSRSRLLFLHRGRDGGHQRGSDERWLQVRLWRG